MKVGFLESSEGKRSLNRLLSLLAFLVAAILAVLTLVLNEVKFGDTFPFIITFLAYSVGTKTFDKVAVAFGQNGDKVQ